MRKNLHPALQYLLLEAGPFNRLGEFPAEQPNDLPLSPTVQVFYLPAQLSGSATSFWLTSLPSRIVFFVIPLVAAAILVIGFARPLYRWLHLRRIDKWHRALGRVERELAQNTSNSRLAEYQKRITEIESAVRTFNLHAHSKSTCPSAYGQEDLDRLKTEAQSEDRFACTPGMTFAADCCASCDTCGALITPSC